MKIKLVAIIGKAGAGKDAIYNRILSLRPDYNKIISCTTRPKRDYETNRKDYFFLSNEEFAYKVLNGEMLEACEFNNWFYGTSIESLDKNKVNIGVFNPDGIECLLTNSNIDLKVFYITASDKTRLIRQLTREEEPNVREILRRFDTDEEDFYNLEFEYITIDNSNDLDSAVNKILGEIN
jgi:guanylate kinase